MSDCDHVLADENGFCIDCGSDAPADTLRLSPEEIALLQVPPGQEFLMVEVPAVVDIWAICQWANEAVEMYEAAIEHERDPECDEPKMRMIGCAMYRPTWEQIFNRIVSRSYPQAVMMGYRGRSENWAEYLQGTIAEKMIQSMAKDLPVPPLTQ